MKEYIEETRPQLARSQDETALFLNPRGDRLTRQGFWQKIKEYAKSANLDTEISPHTLRHSFATHLIEKGVDIFKVQTLLGHSSLDSTRIYINFNSSQIAKAVFSL